MKSKMTLLFSFLLITAFVFSACGGGARPQEGSILAVGPGRILDDGSREAMDVAVGHKVLYAKYAGTEFKVEGEELLIVSQKDILAIVED